MINCLIVDDEPLARQRLRQLLEEHPDCRVVGECGDGLEAVQAIEARPPDLVFLDIQMPVLDGFGVIEAVGAARMPATLFVTAYDQYALQAFEVHALDFLLKPFSRDRFLAALDQARAWLQGQARPPLEPLVAMAGAGRPSPDRFLVKDGPKFVFVKVPMIQWVEAEDNNVRIHVEGTSYLMRQTMAGLVGKLPAGRFRRIHRSAIVNIDFIRELEPWANGELLVIMRDGTQLTLSRTYRNQLEEWL